MGSVTNVLNQGSLSAAFANKELQALLYQELRVIAKSKLSKNIKDNNLNTTALVHEAFIKINHNSKQKKWQDKRHFYVTAALVMQQIIVDTARKKLAEKRGGNQLQVTLDDNQIVLEQECVQLVELSHALTKLQDISPELVELVNLRYFAGFSLTDIAEIQNTSKRSLDRKWLKAKALLQMWL